MVYSSFTATKDGPTQNWDENSYLKIQTADSTNYIYTPDIIDYTSHYYNTNTLRYLIHEVDHITVTFRAKKTSGGTGYYKCRLVIGTAFDSGEENVETVTEWTNGTWYYDAVTFYPTGLTGADFYDEDGEGTCVYIISPTSIGSFYVDYVMVTVYYTEAAPTTASCSIATTSSCYYPKSGFLQIDYTVDNTDDYPEITEWNLQARVNSGSWSTKASGFSVPVTDDYTHGTYSVPIAVGVWDYRLLLTSQDEESSETSISVTTSPPAEPTLYELSSGPYHTPTKTPTWTAISGTGVYGEISYKLRVNTYGLSDYVVYDTTATSYALTMDNGNFDFLIRSIGNTNSNYWSATSASSNVTNVAFTIEPVGSVLNHINPESSYDGIIYLDWEEDIHATDGYSVWMSTSAITAGAVAMTTYQDSLTITGSKPTTQSLSSTAFTSGTYGSPTGTAAQILITDTGSNIYGYLLPISTSNATNNTIEIDSKYPITAGEMYEVDVGDTFEIVNGITTQTYYSDDAETRLGDDLTAPVTIHYTIHSHGEWMEDSKTVQFSNDESVLYADEIVRWTYYTDEDINLFGDKNITLGHIIPNYKYMESPTCSFDYEPKKWYFSPNTYLRILKGTTTTNTPLYEGYVDEADSTTLPRHVVLKSIIDSDLKCVVNDAHIEIPAVEVWHRTLENYCDIIAPDDTQFDTEDDSLELTADASSTVLAVTPALTTTYAQTGYALYVVTTASVTVSAHSYIPIYSGATNSVTVKEGYNGSVYPKLKDGDIVKIVEVPNTMYTETFTGIPVKDVLKWCDRVETRITYWTPYLTDKEKGAQKQKTYWSSNGGDSGISVDQDNGIAGNINQTKLPWKVSKVILMGGYSDGVQLTTTIAVEGEKNYGTIKDTFINITDQTELDTLAETMLTTHNKEFIQVIPDIIGEGIIFPGESIDLEWAVRDAPSDTWVCSGEMNLAEELTTSSVTSFDVSELAVGYTATTGTVYVELNDERFVSVPYTRSVGSTTFTISSTDFSGDNVSSTGNSVFANMPKSFITFACTYNVDTDTCSISALDTWYYPAQDELDLPEQNRAAISEINVELTETKENTTNIPATSVASNTAYGIKVKKTAGATLAFGDLCYVHTDGKMKKAIYDGATTICVCICLESLSADGVGDFLFYGIISHSDWSSVSAQTLCYLGSTAGELTTSAISTNGKQIQAIGYGLTTSCILFNPGLTWGQYGT